MNFKFKSIALAIGLSAGSIIAAPVYAIPVDIEVLAQVKATSNGVTNTDNQGPASSAYASAYTDNAWGSAAGDDTGWSSLRASAYTYDASSFTVSSKLRQVATVTNDFSSAQNFSFDFLISRGSISAYGNHLTGSDFLNASYSATIMVNGVSIWNSAAQVATTALGSELTKTGTDLGGYGDNSYYSWNPFSSSINLGQFGAGETFTLEYTINAFVGGSVSDCEYSGSGYGDGYGYGYGCYSGPGAQFGDPFDFNAINDTTLTATPAASVSEPVGGLLLGAGLLGLAYRRRAKKQS